jgi:peptide/nickel transport system permease protein
MSKSQDNRLPPNQKILARPPGQLSRIVRAMLLSRTALLGALIFTLFVLFAIFASLLAPYDPSQQDLNLRLLPPLGFDPSARPEYPLGTDNLGRDILSRLLYGSRVSLLVGVSTILLSGLVGSLIGALAGFYRGFWDNLAMRLVDVWMAFPSLLMAIVFGAALGPGLFNVVVALSLTTWVVYCRIVRAEVLSIREREYILAAQAIGVRDRFIILRHVLPNVLASILVVSTLQMGTVIVSEASLNFLGVGIQSSVPTWGGMLADGRDFMRQAWWLATFPGIAISAVVFGINLLGDGLRDALDPRLRRR